MNYPECFERLVLDGSSPKQGHCHDSPDLVGWGNPNAKILLLGKEPAIDMNTDSGRNQYSTEVASNRCDWRTNIENRTGFDELFDKYSDKRIYGNPLYPHCWQKSRIRIRIRKDGAPFKKRRNSPNMVSIPKIERHDFRTDVKPKRLSRFS